MVCPAASRTNSTRFPRDIAPVRKCHPNDRLVVHQAWQSVLRRSMLVSLDEQVPSYCSLLDIVIFVNVRVSFSMHDCHTNYIYLSVPSSCICKNLTRNAKENDRLYRILDLMLFYHR